MTQEKAMAVAPAREPPRITKRVDTGDHTGVAVNPQTAGTCAGACPSAGCTHFFIND